MSAGVHGSPRARAISALLPALLFTPSTTALAPSLRRPLHAPRHPVLAVPASSRSGHPVVMAGPPTALAVVTAFDWLGTVAFAFSGTLTAAQEDMTIIGAAFLAVITAVGGGTIRDLLLGCGRAFWLVDIRYFNVCLATCAVTLLIWPTLARRLGLSDDSAWPFAVADSVGLAAFAVLGARKALGLGLHAQGAALSGLLTACGGGVVRDVLCRRQPRILHTTQSAYGSPALLGAALYTALRTVGGGAVLEGTALTLAFTCTFTLRMVAYRLALSPPSARDLDWVVWKRALGKRPWD